MAYRFEPDRLTVSTYGVLRRSVGWCDLPDAQVEAALARSLYSVTVFDGLLPVAMARAVGDGVYCLLADVVVHPQYQGQGIGSQMIELLLQHIELDAPAGSRISIQLIAEPGKESFYEKFGFKRIPHEFAGSGMRKVLHK